MNILITRPSPYGNQLVKQLHAIGKKAWHLPLISFSPGNDLPFLKEHLKRLSDQDLLLIMSQTAIKYAHSCLMKSNTLWPKKIRCYSIGYTTALQTHKLTKIPLIIYPKIQENSEELLRLIQLNKHIIKGKKALILCGNKRRKIVKETLKKQGIHVIICESYSRVPILYNGEEQIKYMIKKNIKTILITSKEILQHLYNLTPNHYKTNWLIKCKLIVISNRIAIHAKKLGWNNITITNTINNNHLTHILSKI